MAKGSFRGYKKAWLAFGLVLAMLVVLFTGSSLALAQDPAQALYDEAMAQYEWGDYEPALATFEELLARYPASDLADDAQYMIGQCYAQLERYDDAIFAFYTAAYQYPQSDRADDALIALGGHLYRQDHMPQALEAYEQVVQEYPQSEHAAYAQTSIGWLYAGMGDLERAQAELEKVATDYPDSSYTEVAEASLEELAASERYKGATGALREEPAPLISLYLLPCGIAGVAVLGFSAVVIALLGRRRKPAPFVEPPESLD